MITSSIFKLLKTKKLFFAVIFVFLMVGVEEVSGAARTASVTGNWNNTATWGGSPVPVAANDVTINNGIIVTVNVSNAQCLSLTFVAGTNATLTVNSTCNLAVTNAVTLNNAQNANVTALISGAGSFSCASLSVGNGTLATNNNSTFTHTLTSTISALTISGNLTIGSYYTFNNRFRNGVFMHTSGTVTVNGSVTTSNADAANTSTLTLGVSSPTLILGGATPFSISGTGTSTITLNGTGATVNYSCAGNQTIYPTNYTDLTLSGSGAKTTAANIMIIGNLYVNSGVIFDLSTFTANRSAAGGTLTVAGTLILGGTTGGTTGSNFPANFSTMTGGTVNYNNPTGGQTIFSTPVYNTLTLGNSSGNQTAGSNLAVATLNNNTNVAQVLNMATNALTVTTPNNTGIIRTQNTTGLPLPSGLTWGGTVNYDAPTGAQTVVAGTYGILTLGNSSGTQTAGGNLSVSTLNNNTNAAQVLNLVTNTMIVTTPNNTGTIRTQNTSGSPITTGKTWGGTVNYDAANGAQTVVAGTYGILTLGNTSGTQTAGGNLSVTTLNNNTNAAQVLNMVTNTLTVTTPNNTGIIRTQNTSVTPVSSAKTWGGTVIFDASTVQTIPTSTFNNLTLSNNGGASLSGAVTVSNIFTLTSGVLTTTGTNLLSITNTVTSSISGGSVTSFINGPVKWTLPASLVSGSNYNFPVGNTTYLPFLLVNPTTGTGVVTAQVQAFTANPGGTYDATLLSKSTTEYWSLVTAGNFTNSSVSLTRQSDITPSNEIGGSATIPGIYTSLGGSPDIYSVSNSNAIGSNRFFVFAKGNPTINISTATLSGFTYPVGYGPSAEQSFTAGGTALSTNISILPTDSFEISLTSGASFVPESLIQLLVSNGKVPTTSIYVRMKAGLGVGSINPFYKITCTSDNATTKTVNCTGTVTNLPVITVTPSSLSSFSYNVGGGPSTAQSFTASGIYLTSNIVLTAPTDYKICLTAGGTYVSTLTLTQSGGNVSATTIYVKLNAGLTGGSYNENISLTSTNAVTQNVACNGSVNAPTVTLSTFTLSGFIYTAGSGPSGEQTVTVSGQYLSGNIVLTVPADFEISTTSGSGFVTTTLTLNQTLGIVNPTIIYVRMKAGLSAGTVVAPINLTAASTGSITQNAACSGTVVSSATIISSISTLNGFVYTFGNGPSLVQSFTVSGSSLTNIITVTPPSDFEICLTSGGTFVSTALTISLTGATVNAIPVYVRLKAGLAVATYSGQNISLTSSPATTQNVACNGIVISAPTITAGPAGLESTCNGATVILTSVGTGIANQYWSGPNGFYSIATNPSLGVVSPTNNGTYTVTGSALSGVNLLTNGDFESTPGNLGVGSSYGYVAPSSTALSTGGTGGGESLYTITNAAFPTPKSVHTNFSTCVDHSNPGSYQMVINGATNPGIITWSQSITVVPGADYQFSYWVQSVFASNPAQLQLYVNGVPAGLVYTADLGTCSWKQFVYNTNAGSNTVLQLTLINQNTVAGGNDFALDDLVFQQIFAVTSSVNLTVNPILAVSNSITASASPLYSGGAVTFTAVPVNGGTSPAYQWKVNGTNVGTSSSVYTYTPVTGDVITCVLTSNYPCTTGSPATSNTLTAILRTNFWKGTTSTDWGTASNWTANTIPSPGNDVEYATVANNTTAAINDLQLDVNRTIGNLVNNTTKALIIPAGKGLIVNNTITTDGGVDRIVIKASPSLPNGSLIFHNAQNIPVQATVEMYSKASWNLTAGTLLKYQWQYFGIPVSSVVAEPTFYGSFVRKWDETGTSIDNHWVQQNNASVIVPFYGYEIVQAAPKTITFQGALVNSNFSVSSLAVSTNIGLFPGQHIFANPYTAAIDIRLLTFGLNTQNIIYMYNTGAYGIWELVGGSTTIDGTIYPPGQYIAIPKNLAGNALLPRQIPSMGTMLIRPVLPVSTDFDFGINYNSVVMNNSELQRVPVEGETSTTGNVGTIIDVKTKYGSDRMWLITESASTRGFDNGWDGQKIPGSALTPQLFAMEVDGNYQVNTVPNIHDSELGFQAGLAIEDTLVFTHQNLEKRYAGLFLVDLTENKTIDITASGTTYTFVAESTPTPVKRFKIVTRPYEKEAADAETQVKIFSSQSSIFVQNLSTQAGECVIYDIAGRYLKKVPFGANCVTAISNNLKPGAYIARANAGSEEISKRLIVR